MRTKKELIIISKRLRALNKDWAKDGDELKLISGIINLDSDIYDKLEEMEASE